MKIRVTWWIGKWRWWQHYTTPEQADRRVSDLLQVGFCQEDNKGVKTFYPPHRISKITRKVLWS